MGPRALILGGALALAALVLASVGGGLFNPLTLRTTPGVDVSWHQGAIDWKMLAREDVRFAYIKATEGGDHVDPRFAENWRGAGQAGLYRGAYHFFTLCKGGAEQARNFIRIAPRETSALPPAVDLEHMGPCRKGPMVADVQAEIAAYLDRVEAHYGERPILYTTRQFHDAHLKGAFQRERFWIRSLFAPPDFRTRDWVIWQHHNKARRSGAATPIDLNAFRGDEKALAAFAAKGGPLPSETSS